MALEDLLSGPPDLVARRLLGTILTAYSPDGVVSIEITETEAYAGASDPASHAFRGPSARNATMFESRGHVYVYRSHGIHLCCNIVTGETGTGAGVLLRAGRVIEGEPLARERRGLNRRPLASGPGNLGQALGLLPSDDGVSLFDGTRIELRETGAVPAIETGPRVGVTLAPDEPWRFWIAGDSSVTKYRRSPRAPRHIDPRT